MICSTQTKSRGGLVGFSSDASPGTLTGTSRGRSGGSFDASKPLVAQRITDAYRQVQTHVGDVREGSARVVGHRRQDGEDHPLEIRVGLSPMRVGQCRVVENVDAGLGESRGRS